MAESAVDKCLAVHVAYFMDAREVHEARRVLRFGGRLVVLVTDKAAMAALEICILPKLTDNLQGAI